MNRSSTKSSELWNGQDPAVEGGVPAEGALGEGGARVGPYRLERILGRGGMGLVFLAHRADLQYEKRVAIKLLSGVLKEDSLQRFRAERQILAKLEHPHIARMLDGGVSQDGEPYFVMDYVPGAEAIDDYCDQQRLTVRERVNLFLDVCDAVHYAHQFLVVHRDLKPSNVQVSRDGVAKLVDFGIAKDLLAADESKAVPSVAIATAGGALSQHTMTPGYASPEQVRGEAIGTASDIYALGVLLYELLVGTTPYLAAPGDIEKLMTEVVDGELVPPSRSYARRGYAASESKLNARGLTKTRQLERLLEGDLDAIICKAMTNSAQDRYASADQLAEDLRRYLAGDLVLASQHNTSYKLKKLLERYRAISSAVATVLFASLFTAGAMGGLAVKYYVDLADSRAEVSRARAASQFLSGIYDNVSPDTTSLEALRGGAARLGHFAAGEPAWKETARAALGRALLGAGAPADALAMFEQTVLQHERDFFEANPDRVRALMGLGDSQRALARPWDAAVSYRRALDARRQLGGSDGLPDVAQLEKRLAEVLALAGVK